MSNIWFISDTHFGHNNVLKYSLRPFFSQQEQAIIDNAQSRSATDEQRDAYKKLKISSESIEQHDEQLIANWNSCVGNGDRVYHLGDFCLGDKTYTQRLVERLNGNIYLVRGNHDKSVDYVKDRFVWIKDYFELKVKDDDVKDGKCKIVLFHYAIREWNAMHYGSWHLHGHSHGSLPVVSDFPCLDVGVDAVANRLPNTDKRKNYRPISFDEIKQMMPNVLI